MFSQPPQCMECAHLIEKKRKGRARCAAFTSVPIPDAIWFGSHDHREPFPGDKGIRFEAKKAESP